MTSKDIPIRVRFNETTGQGIVHHSHYMNWFDLVQTEYLREAGYTYEKLGSMGLTFMPIEMNMKYYSPANFDEELVVSLDIINVTNIKVVEQIVVTRKNDGEKIVSALLTCACVGQDLRPKLLNRVLPDLYQRMVGYIDFKL